MEVEGEEQEEGGVMKNMKKGSGVGLVPRGEMVFFLFLRRLLTTTHKNPCQKECVGCCVNSQFIINYKYKYMRLRDDINNTSSAEYRSFSQIYNYYSKPLLSSIHHLIYSDKQRGGLAVTWKCFVSPST